MSKLLGAWILVFGKSRNGGDWLDGVALRARVELHNPVRGVRQYRINAKEDLTIPLEDPNNWWCVSAWLEESIDRILVGMGPTEARIEATLVKPSRRTLLVIQRRLDRRALEKL